MTHGPELAAQRESAGITSSELARVMGRHQSSVIRLERRMTVGASTATRYRRALEVCINDQKASVRVAGKALIARGIELVVSAEATV